MRQRMWIELLNHPGKANVVVDVLSRKSYGFMSTLKVMQVELFSNLNALQVQFQALESRILLANFNVQPDLIERIKSSQ